jgi:hypothetical protein
MMKVDVGDSALPGGGGGGGGWGWGGGVDSLMHSLQGAAMQANTTRDSQCIVTC